MSTAFTSLAIATGFERRYGVLKRLGSSPLPRSGLLLGKVGALLLVEALQVVVIVGRRARARLGAARRRAPAAARRCARGRSAPPPSPRSGLFVAGVLRAEATLAAANLVYLLLMAGGAVVLPGHGVRRGRGPGRAGCRRARSARRCATALIDGRTAWPDLAGAARLGRASAPS